MISNQKQSASDNSLAVQASGSVTINNGLTPDQMLEIIGSLSAHVERLFGQAKETIDDRLRVFEQKTLARFATDETAVSEAFRDPDFLSATLDAQKSFARSGDETLGNTLVGLIAARSKFASRNRVALTLNDAIQKVGSIPKSDLNLLSLMFFFKHAQINGALTAQSLANLLSEYVVPLLDDISSSDSAFSYLASHGCMIRSPSIAAYKSAMEIMNLRYGTIISTGFSEEALRRSFEEYDALIACGLIQPSPYEDNLYIFRCGGMGLDEVAAQFGLNGNFFERYSALSEESPVPEEKFKLHFSRYLPEIERIFEAYDAPGPRNSQLTSLGLALGHANLSSGIFLKSNLSIWIED